MFVGEFVERERRKERRGERDGASWDQAGTQKKRKT
jgi:hypothetical protein